MRAISGFFSITPFNLRCSLSGRDTFYFTLLLDEACCLRRSLFFLQAKSRDFISFIIFSLSDDSSQKKAGGKRGRKSGEGGEGGKATKRRKSEQQQQQQSGKQ